MPPELLAQFPIAEQAIEALGVTLWPMVEFEADDAIAAAAERFAADPAVERILICTPDKDMAQLRAWTSGSSSGTAGARRSTTTQASGRSGASHPSSVPDRLALVGDAADGFPGLPGWGDKGASAVLARYGHLEEIPRQRLRVGRQGAARRGRPSRRPSATSGRTRSCTATSPACGRLEDGVQIPQQDVEELRWRGADRATWEAFCDEWDLPRLAPARTPGGTA